MAPVTPDGEPDVLVSAASWRWRIPDLVDWPNSESWVLTYRFAGKSVKTFTPTFQTTGDDKDYWLFNEAPADTALSAGNYQLFKYMIGGGTYAGRTDPVALLEVTVLDDPIAALAGALQSQAEIDLAHVRTAITARLNNDVPESYSIAGRSLSKMSIRDLRHEESLLMWRVRAERSGRLSRRVDVYMAAPT